MKVTLCLTHNCNLSCHYCYAGQTKKQDMSLATAQRCVDIAFDSLAEGKTLDIGMFGGEPLLRFDLIREITDYIHRKSSETEKKARISITTNGTLVTQDIIEYIAEKNIALCFSIDGPSDVHNRNRTYRNGSGSFDEIVHRLELALKLLNRVEVNAVFNPDTITELPRSLNFFINFGISLINFNPDIMAVWTDNIRPKLKDTYTQIADYYIGSYTKGHEIAINLIDSKMLLFIKGGYDAADRCSMGDGERAVAPSGNIYPCERFIGTDDDFRFCLGNIHTGLDSERHCALRLKRGNHNPECSTCALKKYCMNWCGCTNYFMSGHTDMSAPILCTMEQIAIRSARYAFNSLVKADNDLFTDHMYNYLNAGIHS